ncbi:hypothetical protein ACLQ24_23580 [Micromonospora sp. DT4]|uniref:hypothetical protein n=1 Tax=Micromonospora sp. DT4 TaxID=3393438 RepID=UPI003CF1950C
MLSVPVRTLRRLVAATATLTLAVGLIGPAPTAATPAGTAPAPNGAADRGPGGDQPLPGYTFQNPPLTPLTVAGKPTTVRQGVHRHAAYIIEVPARWNGELVLWAHGYRGQGSVLSPEPPGFDLRQRMLTQGYAWASSSYDRNGFDIRSGVLSTTRRCSTSILTTTWSRRRSPGCRPIPRRPTT